MESPKLVSIGIPVFNERNRILDCIGSVVAQTYPNVEICVSDNASTDGTYEVVERLAREHTNIRIMRQQENLGASANFDTVLRMASGEYFMWLGADDRILPTYIERTAAQLETHPKAAVAHSASRRVDDQGKLISEARYGGAFDPNKNGPLRQALLTLTPFKSVRQQKLGLYIYGLYRKSVLDRIMDQPERPLDAGDRVLPALAALSGGLRYVDEFLFVKHVHQKSYVKRNPDDHLRDVRQSNTKYWSIVRWVFTCPTIPIWRRWYGLIIAAPFLLHEAQKGLKWVGLPRFIGTKAKF